MAHTHTEIINQEHFERLYAFRAASPALQDLVEFYWQLDLCAQHLSEHDFAERIVANLHSSIVFNLGSAFGIRSRKEADANEISSSVLVGHHTRAFTYHHHAGNFLFGAKLKPVAIPLLFGVSGAELGNTYAGISEVMKNTFLEEQLLALPDVEARAALLDRFLLSRYALYRKDHRLLQVQKALGEAASGCTTTSVEILANRLHLTTRSLERYFKQALGESPRTCLSIMRFRRALQAYHTHGSAAGYEAFGYVDFPHFMKDFRRYNQA